MDRKVKLSFNPFFLEKEQQKKELQYVMQQDVNSPMGRAIKIVDALMARM